MRAVLPAKLSRYFHKKTRRLWHRRVRYNIEGHSQ